MIAIRTSMLAGPRRLLRCARVSNSLAVMLSTFCVCYTHALTAIPSTFVYDPIPLVGAADKSEEAYHHWHVGNIQV